MPEQSATQHSIVIGGKTVNYTATAGTLILRNDKDEPTAAVGYVAYTQRGDADASRRPITFAYNGGPGSSSIWLHMGALGPRRIVTSDAEPTPPPPYRTVDNVYSVIDKTDLVMIDPVGTGLSHAVGDAKDKDFWGGEDPDIESISRFIKAIRHRQRRWKFAQVPAWRKASRTTRSAGIVDRLLRRRRTWPSTASSSSPRRMDIESILDLAGATTGRASPTWPTFAAVAAYHHALPQQPAQLEPFLVEVRKYALGEYATALAKGAALSD